MALRSPLDELLPFSAPSIKDTPLKQLDSGITDLELVKLQIAPKVDPKTGQVEEPPPGQIEEGTYGGTQLALTEMYAKVEEAYVMLMISSYSLMLTTTASSATAASSALRP